MLSNSDDFIFNSESKIRLPTTFLRAIKSWNSYELENTFKKFFHEHTFLAHQLLERRFIPYFFQRTLMVSRGCPVTTQHTPPKPPARKFFKPEVLLVCFFGPSTTFCSAIDSAMLTVASRTGRKWTGDNLMRRACVKFQRYTYPARGRWWGRWEGVSNPLWPPPPTPPLNGGRIVWGLSRIEVKLTNFNFLLGCSSGRKANLFFCAFFTVGVKIISEKQTPSSM